MGFIGARIQQARILSSQPDKSGGTRFSPHNKM
jgi:hypothetical protein